MGSEKERSPLQRTVLFGMLFIFLLLLAVLAGYIFLGRPPAAAPATPPPVDNTTPSATATALPNAPSNLTAEDVAVYDILVGWQDESDNEDGFNVYRQRVDPPGDLFKAGSTGANETDFTDPWTYCGETYEYIVASYNSLGESPTEVCWTITLPPCPAPKALTMNTGVDKGYNFLTGAEGATGDFYLDIPQGGTPTWMADQAGQTGLVDLGDVGDVPLWHVDLPRPTDFVNTGVAATIGHTYAAQASDGISMVVFDAETMDDKKAGLSFIVWKPGDEKTGECTVGRQGRTPPPPKTCECKDGNFQVPGIAAVPADRRCAAHPNATCTCQGDDLQLTNLLTAVFPKDPLCTGIECACKETDWVCTNGFTIKDSQRCTEPKCGCRQTTWFCTDGTAPIPNDPRCTPTEPPPTCPPNSTDPNCNRTCQCERTTLVCSDGTKIANSPRCPQGTQPPVTQPPPEQDCFCENDASGNGWNGDWVCNNATTGAEISRVHDEARCPKPFCGNGQVEGSEQCDGGGCDQGFACTNDCQCVQRQTCTCVPNTFTAAGGGYHCAENPQQPCRP